MLGFYNRSVILTYIGLGITLLGIAFAYEGNIDAAIFCLMISGICDVFDGKIARITKRTKDAEFFGIQIDSLCDLVCFGVFPAFIGIVVGVRGILIIFPILFTVAGVIRLGYFNVMEEKRQNETSEKRKYLDGLPITSSAIIFPLYLVILKLLGITNIKWLMVILYIIVGTLFISKIKVKKPNAIGVAFFLVLAIVVSVILYLY